MTNYYKVRYHEPSATLGLPPDREFVLPGFFVTWVAINGHLSQEFIKLVGHAAVDLVIHRRRTGPQLLQDVDGIVDDEMLSTSVHGFAERYFDLINEGRYLADFCETFGITSQTERDIYVVEDTWANYDRLAPRIDRAFAADAIMQLRATRSRK